MVSLAVHRATVTFSEGRESIRDEPRSGSLTMIRTCENIAHKADISKDRWSSRRLIAEWTRIPRTIM